MTSMVTGTLPDQHDKLFDQDLSTLPVCNLKKSDLEALDDFARVVGWFLSASAFKLPKGSTVSRRIARLGS